MSKVPEHWVLIEAAKRSGWTGMKLTEMPDRYNHPTTYIGGVGYRALCDMIAKYEQPPVDPDVEAVKRIIQAWYGAPISFHCSALDGTRLDVERAVAQYKQERANELRTSDKS